MYAILDVETTGLSAAGEKITEIAIYIHDGKQVVDSFESLINPEKKIPYRIVQMTGITNRMVAGAPRFYEIAKKIVELTEEKTIIGHNVNFDYSFLRNEFKGLGYDFQRKTLCTVKLSRKLIPGRPSYSLGKLCNDLGINNHARHRAAGDALATARLFELLLTIDPNPENLKANGVKSGRNRSLTENLPKGPGVYYFYDKDGGLIYIGKSINIHDRVLSHLNNNLHKKAVEMKDAIDEVGYELTGNELVALLLESAEIKKHQPLYNRTQRRTFFNYGLYSFTDEKGYINLKVSRIIDRLSPLYTYSSLQEGKEHLFNLTEKFNLCQKLCGLYNTQGACFQYQIHQCQGACSGEEQPENYNQKVNMALENYHFGDDSFFIVGQGRNDDEKSVVKIERGKYTGFGFIDPAVLNNDPSMLHECIQPQQDNKEVRQIINSFIKKNSGIEILEF
ncbi:MAG TPA: DNA polymerase III subunit epsilon [Bacteroidetes bacterium]|nr:DNA polymerase III subunit epsilon [Bacteroidota bacterium]